jgi:hypothetical protein
MEKDPPSNSDTQGSQSNSVGTAKQQAAISESELCPSSADLRQLEHGLTVLQLPIARTIPPIRLVMRKTKAIV